VATADYFSTYGRTPEKFTEELLTKLVCYPDRPTAVLMNVPIEEAQGILAAVDARVAWRGCSGRAIQL